MRLTNFSGVIFDLDGLVLDTEQTYSMAWQQAAALLGYELSNEFCLSFSGLSGQAVRERLLQQCGADFDLMRFSELSGKAWRDYVETHGIEVKQGFFELLAQIKKHNLPYCLATNSRQHNALECLALAGLSNVFELIVSRDDVSEPKPSPEVFLKAADCLNVPIAQCLILEDSHTGVMAGHQAGAFVCYVPSTVQILPETLTLANVQVSSLSDVVALF